MENYPKPIVKSCMKTIYNQMEDLIYKIHGNNENYTSCFTDIRRMDEMGI